MVYLLFAGNVRHILHTFSAGTCFEIEILYACDDAFESNGGVFLAVGNRSGGPLYSLFMIESLTKYLQFFTAGLLVRKFWESVTKVLANEKFFNCAFVLFVVLFIIMYIEGLPNVVYKLIHDVVIRYVGAAVVFSIFFHEREKLNEPDKAKVLKFIGRRTLDIYLIHNFFVPNLSFMLPALEHGNQVIIELLVSVMTTALIVTVCLAVSWIIRRSDTLAWYCFGVSKKKPEIGNNV